MKRSKIKTAKAIKLALTIKTLKKCLKFKCKIIATAQHRDMLDKMLQQFNIKIDNGLGIYI